ncbi:DNA polymerase/3'-5' exonuclease PolX [Echinicola jeungdonensis]|uniref:DNA polymerase/3'-5' exonuclease PolX n=1 Tax=Echinicola jeungdonensis TaxID=709343 RepID=A0ABV5J7X2_9BACT|nr:DNA polymerase/3'-5' exonuclease PolX [Echinicola jeungdonensis]MDN3670007.1 DNA polymerase/3'-5' exonuclease PolX [Echinicola jeungdonensis]
MDNKNITKILKLTIQLMELHEENTFKVRSYQSAVNTIDRGDISLEDLDQEGLQKISGIGKSIAEVILDIQETGSHPYLDDLLEKTPKGLLEVLEIKGLGPKKIKTLWKELNITSTHELMEACQSGKVANIKGFGEKTQESIIQALEYMEANLGKWLYADIEKDITSLNEKLNQAFGKEKVSITGDYARNLEILENVEWIICSKDRKSTLKEINQIDGLKYDPKKSSPFNWRGQLQDKDLDIIIHHTDEEHFINEKLIRTGSKGHLLSPLENQETLGTFFKSKLFSSEEEAYKEAGLAYILPELREGQFELEWAKKGEIPDLLIYENLKGILHNHSTYSDGKHSLREMAEYCKELGFEYLGISDHSQTASYAGGLDVNKVQKQQEEIKALNEELDSFKIFSGIESDILLDGSLDYPEETLASFDFIVASIHSSLGMNKKKATARVLKAIENPYTTILGHPTGRLLLRREGYPLDHKTIIEACAKHEVIIEINANPWRLDLDWRWVHYALEKGVQLSINPDAHEKAGFLDMKYGVLVGRKGGLTKDMTFNAKSAQEVAEYFEKRKEKIKA